MWAELTFDPLLGRWPVYWKPVQHPRSRRIIDHLRGQSKGKAAGETFRLTRQQMTGGASLLMVGRHSLMSHTWCISVSSHVKGEAPMSSPSITCKKNHICCCFGLPGGPELQLPAMQEAQVQSLGQEDPLEKEWKPTPVFLPGKSLGQRSLTGYSPWGCKEWETT